MFSQLTNHYTLKKVLNKLIGDIEPTVDVFTSFERVQNLRDMMELADWMIFKIEIFSEYKDDDRDFFQESGKVAKKWLIDNGLQKNNN